MRPIKFRAWDKKEDKMVIWLDGSGYDLYGSPEFEDYSFYGDDRFIPMQFTGIKDKKGKEIYEGDIVKTNNEYYPIQIVQYTADIINYHDGDWDEWYVGFDLRVPSDKCDVLHYRLTDEVEVIGNIYENPELLKN